MEKPDDQADLPRDIDAEWNGGGSGGRGIVQCAVVATAQEVAVGAAGVGVLPDDLAYSANGMCQRVAGVRRGIVEGGVSTAAQEEAVVSAVVVIVPYDLAPIIDAGKVVPAKAKGSSKVV